MITERFTQLVYETNLPLEKLAEEIGVSRHSIYHWMDCKYQPTIETFRKICVYFNVSADWLLGLKEERK